MMHKSFVVDLAEVIARHWPGRDSVVRRLGRALMPNLGTVLVVIALLYANNVIASPGMRPSLASSSTTTISYQGRLADSSGNPITTSGVAMQFRLYDVDTGGTPLWEETQAAVPEEDGLFHVLLGSTNPIPVSLLGSNSTLWLGITVGSDSEMTPREQIVSVPYATVANTVLSLGGWERDESSTADPTVQSETNLLLQHGYAQHVVTSAEISVGYYDHSVTFPTPYKSGTVPTVVFAYTGQSAFAADVAKGGTTNGAGENTGRVFAVTNTGFTIRATSTYADRRYGFMWIAIGQQ